MSELLPFIVVGIATGSVYSLAGVGLVLTFKTSGIFNFAHGALGTVAAYLFYSMHFDHSLGWGWAMLIVVGLVGPLLGVFFETFARGLTRVSVIWQIAATVGILMSIQAFITIFFDSQPKIFPHFLPMETFRVGGVNVTYEQLIVTLVSMVATFGLWLSFRLTRTGIAMRAVVEGPELLSLTGTNPSLVRRAAWMIGCSFATLSGLLIAPTVSLDPFTLTLLIIASFGAAAIGRFSSIPMTWVGGIVLGVAGSIFTKYASVGSFWFGMPASLPVIVLIIVLLVSPSSMRGNEVDKMVRPRPWTFPGRVQIVFAVVVVGVLVYVPELVGYRVNSYTIMLTSIMLLMSFGLLVRVAGQASLCQITFAAIGVCTFSRFAVRHGLPWGVALLLAAVITAAVGVLLAIPAIRVSTLYLALVTLGFGILVKNMFYPTTLMFGSAGYMPRPHLSWITVDSPKGYYYLVLVITVLVAIGLVALDRSRLGRLLRGVAESPVAMRASGHGVELALLLVFGISASVAALAGALNGMTYGGVSPLNYNPIESLTFFVVVMISVGREPWYALIPGAALVLLPLYVDNPDAPHYLQLMFGLFAVILALSKERRSATMDRIIHGFFDRFRRQPTWDRIDEIVAEPRDERPVVEPAVLEAREIAVRFGGLMAVRDVSFTAPPGRITGLIGPNGAGKTTTLNVCSGFVSPGNGSVSFGGRAITGASVVARARAGIGRTFQLMELCDTLTVWENVVLAREASLAGKNVVRQVASRPGDAKLVDQAVSHAIERCGLTDVAGQQAGLLTSSQRRLLEIARCLAGDYQMLLLDEPSSGLDRRATEELGQMLRAIVRQDGIGILLVEHDMSLVMAVCDYIYVMDFGIVIFEGEPAAVQASEIVRLAYLGGQGDNEPAQPEAIVVGSTDATT